MFFWFTFALYILCGFCIFFTLISGLLRYRPADLVFVSIALVWLGFVAQFILSFVAPTLGNPIKGDVLQFYLYAACSILIPIVSIVYVFIERAVWGNYVLLLVALASIAILWRMQVIWG